MATITLDIPDAEVPAIRAAFGAKARAGRPATVAEVKAALIDHVNDIVSRYEAVLAIAAAEAARENRKIAIT